MSEENQYLAKITPEHRHRKFLKWLESNLNFVDVAVKVLNEFDSAFDLEQANGDRLDIIGEILGRKRLLDFEPASGGDSLLDDEMYRSLQKAKICINHWDGTIPSAVELWKNLFPNYEIMVVDNQDMTISVYILGDASLFERELIGRGFIAPKPQGVRINYEFNSEENFESNLFCGISFSSGKYYTFYHQADYDYEVDNNLFTGESFGDSKMLTMYSKGDYNYEINMESHIGSGYLTETEIFMK